MNMKQIASKAASKFMKGYNCAESVLLTMAEHDGVRSELIPRIATPFGGGLARSASVCGSVTGALMAIGMKYGRRNPTEDRLKAYTVATNFMAEFEKRFGSLICYDLIGCDFRTPDGHRRFEELKKSRCANLVKGAVEIVLETEKGTV